MVAPGKTKKYQVKVWLFQKIYETVMLLVQETRALNQSEFMHPNFCNYIDHSASTKPWHFSFDVLAFVRGGCLCGWCKTSYFTNFEMSSLSHNEDRQLSSIFALQVPGITFEHMLRPQRFVSIIHHKSCIDFNNITV